VFVSSELWSLKTFFFLKVRGKRNKRKTENSCHSSRHQIARFKVTEKPHNVATRTAEPWRVKRVQNSQRSKARNAVLVNKSVARAVKLFCGIEV
jgi:hypothetical protein